MPCPRVPELGQVDPEPACGTLTGNLPHLSSCIMGGVGAGGQVGNELPEGWAQFHLAYQHVNRCGSFWYPVLGMGQKCSHHGPVPAEPT